MESKTMKSYHLDPVRMAIIKKDRTSAGETAEKRESLCTAGGNVG